MKLRLGRLRAILLEALLLENPAGASGSDPLEEPKGAYDYDYDIGTDQWIAGPNAPKHWYRSPGSEPGTEGDPFRPENADEYLGLKPPADDTTASPPAADDEEGTEARGAETDVDDARELPGGL